MDVCYSSQNSQEFKSAVMEKRLKILVVVNPYARGGKTLPLLPKIRRWLSESPHDFSFSITKSPEEMRSEIIKAPFQGVHATLLFGGDGTVHEALPTIAKTNIPFGLLPYGRGNDLARAISSSINPRRTCNFPTRILLREFDLPTINKTPFMTVANVGFDADVNKLANEGKGYWNGRLGYSICVLKAVKHLRPFEIEITIDDHCWRERVMMVTIANGPFYGGGMKIAPEAIMNDGLLDICIVKEISKWELLRQFPKVFKGTHTSHPKILMKSGRRIKLISDEQRDVFGDGEYIGNLPAECIIGGQTVQIIVPSQAPGEK